MTFIINRSSFLKLLIPITQINPKNKIIFSEIPLHRILFNKTDKLSSNLLNIKLSESHFSAINYDDIIFVNNDGKVELYPFLNSFDEYRQSISLMHNHISSVFPNDQNTHSRNIQTITNYCKMNKNQNWDQGVEISKMPLGIQILFNTEFNFGLLSSVYQTIKQCHFIFDILTSQSEVFFEETEWKNSFSSYRITYKTEASKNTLMSFAPSLKDKNSQLFFNGITDITNDPYLKTLDLIITPIPNANIPKEIRKRSLFVYENSFSNLSELNLRQILENTNYSLTNTGNYTIIKNIKNKKISTNNDILSYILNQIPINIMESWRLIKSTEINSTLYSKKTDPPPPTKNNITLSKYRYSQQRLINSLCFNKEHTIFNSKFSECNYLIQNFIGFLSFSQFFEALDYIYDIIPNIPNNEEAVIQFRKQPNSNEKILIFGKKHSSNNVRPVVLIPIPHE